MALPNSVNYNDIPEALKSDVISTTIVINPVNCKSSYVLCDVIIFDYNSGQRGFIDPKSIYLSYKACVVTPNVANGAILGTPVYSPFLIVDTIINSQTIESVNQWNQVCQAWVQCNMSVADKAGVQTAYGYLAADDTVLSSFDYRALTQNIDGVNAADAVVANNRYFVSAPLICNILTGCEKLIPACLMPQIRQQLTVDSLLNFVTSAATVTSFYIYNIQITYQLIDFGSEVQNMVMSMPKFIIKSNGWSNSATTIGTGVVGSQSIIFNQRFASIKSALILACNGTNAVNKLFDFMDITNSGTYQIQIGSITFPQLQLNAGTNRSAIIQELRKSQGNLYDTKNSMSINTVEFSRSDVAITAVATTLLEPRKFIIGIDTTRLGCGSSKNLLNGTSSQNSPITVLLNIATATGAAQNLNLVLNYDALLEFDPSTSMVSARV